MITSNFFRVIVTIGALNLIASLGIFPKDELTAAPLMTKTPTPIYGGEWKDDLLNSEQLSATSDVQISGSGLILKITELLNWKQTWTAHFALGEFYQTEAISDSVRLAPADGSSQYFTTGVYTSTIFDAGRPVDWLSGNWVSSGTPYSVTVEFRTGNTTPPDDTWANWDTSKEIFGEYSCAYSISLDRNECITYLSGIESSRYFQYRVTFTSNDPSRTLALNEIVIAYGIHASLGTAITAPISPIDLRSWKEAFYTSTIPISTVLTIDVLSLDGTVLLPNVISSDSLTSIDPLVYSSIRLRATMATNEMSRTPELDIWGLRWAIGSRLYLPMILR